MKQVLLVSLTCLLIASSCRNNEPEAFAYGNFESEEIIVSAQSTGSLMEFKLEEGAVVKAGQMIGYIDTTQLYLKKKQLFAGLESVKARLYQLDQQLKVNEVSMSNAVREQKRISSLLEGGAATARQMDDINGQIDLLKAQTAAVGSQKVSIAAERESLLVQISQVNDLIAKSLIICPVSGTVLEKYIYTGELAVAGKPLFKVADISELILRVFVSGQQLESLKIGEEVNVGIDTNNGGLKTYKGTVSWISSKSEFTPKIIQTRDERVNLVYAVKIRVANDGSLKIGMPAQISL
ncbi:MAG: HlyD family efflux transporter periplasmic adaptor subunit [Bacteroidales bacterium]|nr:HlyD family efflux transporter periplasmic adaptor subunit [Bacteroidales bacterium]MCB8998869.1 HlyD family efflux transporter periplasmic adaptor subunit [Bacteroidales bacterium]MCB9013992.1 HlyD family efflux transporter periplasmic adaptor subunit [Bacteroidales bacterium]